MGYKIFALCVRQLMSNWQMAVRLSWFWSLAFGLPYIGSLGFILAVSDGPNPPQPLTVAWAGMMILLLLAMVFGVAAYCIIAIGWHRFILREEVPDRFYVLRPEWSPVRYFRNSMTICILIGLITMPIMAVALLFLLSQLTPPVAALNLAPIALGVMWTIMFVVGSLNTWIALRVGMILPASALNETMTIPESYRLTGPLAGQLLVTSVCIVSLLIVPLIMGHSLQTFASHASVVMLLVAPVFLVWCWITFFVGFGILTVVYGHLAENRPI